MAERFGSNNESRMRGALGSLEQAVACMKVALAHGECPLSATSIKDAEQMAAGASTLLSYVYGKGDW